MQRGTALPALMAAAMLCAGICTAQSTHAFSVRDDISMNRLSDPSEEDIASAPEDAHVSPDQHYFAVVTTRGVLQQDTIESTLSLFDARETLSYLRGRLSEPPKPRAIATIAAKPHDEENHAFTSVIRDLRWAEDGRHIYFRGRGHDGGFRLFRADIANRKVLPLTPEGRDVNQYALQGDTFVYSYCTKFLAVPAGARLNQDAWDVTGIRLNYILFPAQMQSYKPRSFGLARFTLRGEKIIQQDVPNLHLSQSALTLEFFPFRLSPKGDKLLFVAPTDVIPTEWSRYDPALHFEHRRLHANDPELTSPDNILSVRRYTVVDLSTGKLQPVIESPNAWALGYSMDRNRADWSSDASRLLITNTFLPLKKEENDRRHLPCVLAEVSLTTKVVSCLRFGTSDPAGSDSRLRDVAYGPQGQPQELVKTNRGPYKLRAYRWVREHWEMDTENDTSHTALTRTDAAEALQVFVKQDLNTMPQLWGMDLETRQARALWNPNPQLDHIDMGQASVFRWKDTNDKEWVGGLVKPVGYESGKRYPLVVQMYQFDEHRFLTDGTDPTAFAARQLASAGFVVLQIRKKPSVLSEEDPKVHLEAYRSAIHALDQEGLIDPQRVGAVGFSWTCWYVINALVKDPRLFSAATIADGLDNSYMQYLLFSPGPPNLHEQMDTIRGTNPFGNGLHQWVKDAPGFHLDRVVTPVRIEAINPSSILQEWELYASLELQHKAVDLIYFPEGTHIHQLPQERMESQQGNIDWMRFWLQDYEDPSPAKRLQYERWHKMRDLNEKQPAF